MPRLYLMLGAIGVLVVHHLFFYYGHFGYDDLHYARLASDLLNGNWDAGDHYAYRIVPLGAIALSYALFGVNDLSSALPALLASTAILWLFYKATHGKPWWVFLLALGLYFSLKWNLFYSDKLMPDVFVSCFAFAAWYLCVGKKSPVLVALCLFLAFNSKGTVILIAPLFAYLLIRDLIAGHYYRYWAKLCGVSLLLLLAYFGLTAALTGAPLTRLSAISANSYLNACSYDQLPFEHLRSRLTTDFAALLYNSLLGIHLFVAVVTGLRWRSVDRQALATIAICLLSMNFMSISLTSYNPVCLDTRHLMLFTPILAVSSATLLSDLLPDRKWTKFSVIIATILLLLPAAKFAHYARTLEYPLVRQAFEELIEKLPAGTTLYGSEVLKNYGDYVSGFRGEPVFLERAALPDCASVNDDYLVKNWYTDWHAGAGQQRLDSLLEVRGIATEIVPELSSDKVSVYRLGCR